VVLVGSNAPANHPRLMNELIRLRQRGGTVIVINPVLEGGLLKFGSPEQKARYLPRIREGDDFWVQGYSEPGSGSDLASIRTKATRSHKDGQGNGWVINGSKLWTSGAHRAHYMIALVRSQGAPSAAIARPAAVWLQRASTAGSCAWRTASATNLCW
jgi:alkylation response protein AidB-like acyl-CoA dehydrogenase